MKDYYTSYGDPKQIVLTNDFQAVFAVPVSGDWTDQDSPMELYSRRVDALAVVTVTTWDRESHSKVDSWDEIVGLELVCGSWEISNDCDNFSGLCRVGESTNDATMCLNPKYKLRLTIKEAK